MILLIDCNIEKARKIVNTYRLSPEGINKLIYIQHT